MNAYSLECRVCRAVGFHPTFSIMEMMLGTHEEFEYFECQICNSLQRAKDLTSNEIARYYPKAYYSFEPPRNDPIVRWLRAQRDRHILGLPNVGGALLPERKSDSVMWVLREAGIRPSDQVLDVGCGAGLLLDRLANIGFQKLLGADPFIAREFATRSGVPIQKRHLSELTDTFDVIMFHHSLEHVPHPAAALRDANSRLPSGGLCLARIPTSSSVAWEIYRENWVQLDAPRHVVIPSRKGMESMAREAGFALEKTIDDSEAFQFIGSELYRRGVPLQCRTTHFGRADVMRFAQRARELNALHRGDQAAFILRKINPVRIRKGLASKAIEDVTPRTLPN